MRLVAFLSAVALPLALSTHGQGTTASYRRGNDTLRPWSPVDVHKPSPMRHRALLPTIGKSLLPVTNESICGLPMTTKANRKHVLADKSYKVGITLVNTVAQELADVVLQLILPQGTRFRKGSALPPSRVGKYPLVRQQGTKIVWRDVHMRAGQRRYFQVVVDILCTTRTPLVFRPYTTIDGIAWIRGPEAMAHVVSWKACLVVPPGPIDVTEFVAELSEDPMPPVGVWTSGRNSYNSIQRIQQLPSDRRWLPTDAEPRVLTAPAVFPYALRQQTLNDPSRAAAGAYYEPYGICDGLLFKDFVLGGVEIWYIFYVDSTPAGFEDVYAPNLRIQTRSPATDQYSDFVWDPYLNNQTSYQTWVISSMDQSTGLHEPWPDGPSGGAGWTCTLGCYLPENTTIPDGGRSLETIVQSLLGYDQCSSTFCAISDAIVTGIEVVLGPDEPNTVAFTREVGFRTGTGCSFRWIFGPS